MSDLVMLERLKVERPDLWRALVAEAKARRGRAHSDRGDVKRALVALVGRSGRQRVKARKAIQRAMRDQSLSQT